MDDWKVGLARQLVFVSRPHSVGLELALCSSIAPVHRNDTFDSAAFLGLLPNAFFVNITEEMKIRIEKRVLALITRRSMMESEKAN